MNIYLLYVKKTEENTKELSAFFKKHNFRGLDFSKDYGHVHAYFFKEHKFLMGSYTEEFPRYPSYIDVTNILLNKGEFALPRRYILQRIRSCI